MTTATDHPGIAPTITIPTPTMGTERNRVAELLADAAWKLRNGYDPGGSTVTGSVARLCDDAARAIDPEVRTGYAGVYKRRPGAVDETLSIHDLTAEQRYALPAQYHRPYFDGLGEPNSWICVVCYDAEDATTTAWPCDKATRGGHDVARACGLEYSR